MFSNSPKSYIVGSTISVPGNTSFSAVTLLSSESLLFRISFTVSLLNITVIVILLPRSLKSGFVSSILNRSPPL